MIPKVSHTQLGLPVLRIGTACCEFGNRCSPENRVISVTYLLSSAEIQPRYKVSYTGFSRLRV